MSGAQVPEHAARIETPHEIYEREDFGGCDAVAIDRDQIRRGLTVALFDAEYNARAAVERVRAVLDAIGGVL